MGNNYQTKIVHNQLKQKYKNPYKEWITLNMKKWKTKKQIQKLSKMTQLKMLDLKGTILSFIQNQQNNLFLFIQAKKLALSNSYLGGLDSLQQMISKDINQLLQVNSLNDEFYQVRRQVQLKYRQQNLDLKSKLQRIYNETLIQCELYKKKFFNSQQFQQRIAFSNLKMLKEQAYELYENLIDQQIEKVTKKIQEKLNWRNELRQKSSFNSSIQKKVDLIIKKSLAIIDTNAKNLVGGYFDQEYLSGKLRLK